MTANHEHTPTTEAEIREDFSNRQAGAINRAVARENFDHMIAAAEQRGAVKAWRNGYVNGVQDERHRASIGAPEEPNRANPYVTADQMKGDE